MLALRGNPSPSHQRSLSYNGLFINVVAIKHSSIPWLSRGRELAGILKGNLLASGCREEGKRCGGALPPPRLHLERATSPSRATNLPSTPTELQARSGCSLGPPADMRLPGCHHHSLSPRTPPGAAALGTSLGTCSMQSTCLSLLSCPAQRGWHSSQPSDELNLPDRLDLPLVPRDAFTSSWLWQRQTCSDTLAVAQSRSPRVSRFSLSLCRARCELCTDKPILISSPCAPRSLQLHLCNCSGCSMTALFNKNKGVPVPGEFSANQMLWI